MATATRELVSDYVEAIAGRFDDLVELLHPDASFTGAVKEAYGREAYIAGFRRLLPILVRIDVRQIVVDGDQAVVLYDFVTDTEAGAVLSSELLTFENGLIRSSVLLYDQRQWPLVLRELGRRTDQPAAVGA